MIKSKTEEVRAFIKGLINKDMSSEDIEKHQKMLDNLDAIDKDEESYTKEINSCKDKIVSLIKSEGSANPPQEEENKKPRSLEEIAKSISNGGK